MSVEHGYHDDSGEWIVVDPRYEIHTTGPLQEYRFAYRDEWWGRLALWVDASINHPLILNAGWQNWVPVRIGESIVWPFYQFCVWAAQWDEPLLPGDPRWDDDQ